jgi:hypothetical protein
MSVASHSYLSDIPSIAKSQRDPRGPPPSQPSPQGQWFAAAREIQGVNKP